MESSVTVNVAASTIYLNGDVDDQMVTDFRRKLAYLQRKAPSKPLVIEINSEGGDTDAGFAISDTIQSCPEKIVTRVTGKAMSAATLILASGDQREALPNAVIMLHQGSYEISGTFNDLKKEWEEICRCEALYSELLNRYTRKEAGYWEAKWAAGNFYLRAEEALREGLIDTILGRSV